MEGSVSTPGTTVRMLTEAQTQIKYRIGTLGLTDGEAAREFALANTAIEDAIMRTNRGYAKLTGVFKVADVQAEQQL